jgi:hypothetical protein
MSVLAREILDNLRIVDDLRNERESDPLLGEAVTRLKAYQQRRFERTYADLLQQPRYAAAARFFLDDLYGPRDFAHRDSQFARIVPSLVRLFPREVAQTVATLAKLHALSETMDTATARHCAGEAGLDALHYVQAWRATGQAAAREQQVQLTLQVGQSLDAYTRNPLLRGSLRLMRGPAKAAGLGALQAFLESGFDAFSGMRGARVFLDTIGGRERSLIAALFSDDAIAWATTTPAGVVNPTLLGQLP